MCRDFQAGRASAGHIETAALKAACLSSQMMSESRGPPTGLAAKYGPWAVVTGASSGIGAAFASRLAKDGFNQVLVARRADRLDAIAGALTSVHPSVAVKVIVADLSEPAGRAAVLDGTDNLDVGLLVNNAGVEQFGSLWSGSVESVENLLKLNCHAPLVLLYEFVNRMLAAKRCGGVINVSSMGDIPSRVTPLYSATKAFMSTLSGESAMLFSLAPLYWPSAVFLLPFLVCSKRHLTYSRLSLVGLAGQVKSAGIDILACRPGPTESEMVDRGRAVLGPKAFDTAIPAAACVDESVSALGKTTCVSTGMMAKVVTFITSWMPRRFFGLLDGHIESMVIDKSVLALRPNTTGN
jgi:short-subunit dehydrogenase